MFNRIRKSFVPATHLSVKQTVQLRRNLPGKPAASVDLIKKAGVSFEKKVESAVKVQMRKGVSGTRWAVIGLLDESYSMESFFRDGTVQEVTERALAWTAGVDNDGMAPFGGFANGHVWHNEVDLTNVIGIVQNEGWNTWGGTDLTASLRAVLDLIKSGLEDPVYLFIVTDGAPNDQNSVVSLVKELSQYPVFIKILRVGNDLGAARFTEYLDDMEMYEPAGRLVDNVDCQHIAYPNRVSDDEFNEMMTEETDNFLAAAKAVGLVTE